ncbi:hypothetical protein BRARA_H00158 [Brassica rapa]|uniref:DUF4283 domain-containing protein n=1 Tax=Brassica campestris TaxID=3711 RepID=A0A397YHG1_BRACM|nr:hypothetical protein BRARA_H00158 [Brassica rapa]
MDLLSAPPPAPSEPPWPPDLCLISREASSIPAGNLASSMFLHPEVPPLHPLLPLLPSPQITSPPLLVPLAPPASSSKPSTATAGPSSSPSSASWVSKLKSSAHNLKKMASPTFAEDGTPVVMAPESVILKSSDIWKGYLVAQFHGTPPSPAKIFADLNPIWGKQGRIRVRYHSKNVCLIFIPCEIIRKWVLDVGFWHSGKCAFSVFEWSPKINLAPMRLEYAPVWVLFRGIPQELWSLECFSTFATGVGFPVQSEFPKLPPYSNGVVKLKVIIKLAGKRASTVKVVDKLGNSVFISAEYLKVPHKCGICSEFGHSELRCPDRQLQNTAIATDNAAPPPAFAASPAGSAASPAASPADNLNNAAQSSTSARAAVVPTPPSLWPTLHLSDQSLLLNSIQKKSL